MSLKLPCLITLSRNCSETAGGEGWEVWSRVVHNVRSVHSNLESFVFAKLERLAGIHIQTPLTEVIDVAAARLPVSPGIGYFSRISPIVPSGFRAAKAEMVHTDCRLVPILSAAPTTEGSLHCGSVTPAYLLPGYMVPVVVPSFHVTWALGISQLGLTTLYPLAA